MLAHFSLLSVFFRSWLVLERFLHFFGSCWSFFSGFGSLRPRLWMVGGRFCSLQNRIRRGFLAFARTHHRNAFHATKPLVFATFYRLRNMSHTATKRVFCIAFEAFLDMVQWWLPKIPAGLHFLLFITTLKRGGTCAAHGIGPKLAWICSWT